MYNYSIAQDYDERQKSQGALRHHNNTSLHGSSLETDIALIGTTQSLSVIKNVIFFPKNKKILH